MKRSLNVIDLDETLVPFDSLRLYVQRTLLNSPARINLAWHCALRLLRVNHRSDFLARILRTARSTPDYEHWSRAFSEHLLQSARSSVLQTVEQFSEPHTLNVLCSASPADYVAPLATALGWESVSSDFEPDGTFVHAYGGNKANLVRKMYPPERFAYELAIADSTSDKELLGMFRYPILVRGDFDTEFPAILRTIQNERRETIV